MGDQKKESTGYSAPMLDKAISDPQQDRFGYRHIAQQLALAIKGIGREGSAVVGIEGAWGSGKTSLLNLLRSELESKQEARTFVLTVSPWLDGDDTSPVESLLLPVARIIADEEEKKLSPRQQRQLHRKKEMTETAKTVFRYTKSTVRHLSPVAELAALYPGIPNVVGALKALSETGLEDKRKTTAEQRADIADKIAALDLSFIVLLDDLDRLEPAQAVEIIRLIKSVADFPRFRYILCYDKAILSQAIKTGLQIEDGSAYLQKIVQISFSLPRPESFDLRRQFLDGASHLYESVNGSPPGDDIAGDLHAITDTFGAALKTPREVQLALNGLRFRYEGVRDYVCLPDLCFLQLLQVTHRAMYDWIEFYLTERSVVESGDGSISEDEQNKFLADFREQLALTQPSPALFMRNLQRVIPGITGYHIDSLKLFQPVGDKDKSQMTESRRLGSHAYWRYYFAFSSPQNILPPYYFEELFRMAGNMKTWPAMTEELLGRINSNGVSSRTWFEHILSQLTSPMINQQTPEACAGLLAFLFNSGDEVISRYRARNRWFSRHELEMSTIADRLLLRMLTDDREKALFIMLSLVVEGSAWIWIAEYIRHLLWQNGMEGDRPVAEYLRVLDEQELKQARNVFSERLKGCELLTDPTKEPELEGFIWAWRDIGGMEAVTDWVTRYSTGDEGFLTLLLSLRTHIISSSTGHYLILKIKDIAHLFGGEEVLQARLSRISVEGRFSELVKEVSDAIQLSKSF